jgi:hypothetical protein
MFIKGFFLEKRRKKIVWIIIVLETKWGTIKYAKILYWILDAYGM